MSVLSRDRASEAGDPGGLRQLAVVIVPVAKRAEMAARDGARSAATWAAPHIDEARAWIAPRIEGSGLAIRETVAPRICEVLVATARRVEVTPPGADAAARRRWPAATAGMVVLAAAGAAMAAVIQRRKAAVASGAPQAAVAGASQTAPDGRAGGNGRAGADGRAGAEDSRPSPA